MGEGEFVKHMLNNDLIPPPNFHPDPLGIDGASVLYPEERDTVPIVLMLAYEVMLHAVRLGVLAHELRHDPTMVTADMQCRAMTIKFRRRQVYEIQESLRRLWTRPDVQGLTKSPLPPRAEQLYLLVWTRYRACIIYSHTSIWPGQRMHTSPDSDSEIAAATQQILQLAEVMIANDSYGSRFLIFPLFMAGVASMIAKQKMLALNLIQQVEREAIGRIATITRQTLEAIYQRQNQQLMVTG